MQKITPLSFMLPRRTPFSSHGEAPNRNDVTLLGGPFAKDTAGGAIRVFGADYTRTYLLGATYGRDVYDLGAGFLLGGVAGIAIRFGSDDDTSGETWAGVRLKHQGLVIGDVAISPAFTAGLSAVTGETEIEKRREENDDGDASFLGFLGPELSVRWRSAPNLELTYQLHHRSGAGGTLVIWVKAPMLMCSGSLPLLISCGDIGPRVASSMKWLWFMAAGATAGIIGQVSVFKTE